MAHLLSAYYKALIPVSQTFSATGTAQTFIVPVNLIGGTITVDMAGAAGGTYSTASGGLGGRVQCVLPATPGDTWTLAAGTAGITSPNLAYATSFRGGGGFGNSQYGGGGGGESDIRVGGTALANRKVVAGGGGGAGNPNYSTSLSPVVGGAGGGTTAGDGGGAGYKGFGATPTAKGTNGPNGSHDGVQNDGGRGPNFGQNQGGGGGGGYWGGGGGGCEATTANGGGGGGGGSSYADPAATSVVHTQGYQAGNGYITLTYLTSTYVLNDSEAFTATENPLSTTDSRGLTWTPYGAAVFDSSAGAGGFGRCKTGPLAWGGNGDICTVDEGQANGQLQLVTGIGNASQGYGIAFRVGPYTGVNGYLALIVTTATGTQAFFYVQKYVAGTYSSVYAGTVNLTGANRRIKVQMNGTAVLAQCCTSDGLTVLDSVAFTDSSFSANTRHGIAGYAGGSVSFFMDYWEFDV